MLFRYPKVCQMISKIETFNRFPQQIRELIIAGVQGTPPNSNQGSLIPATQLSVGDFSNIKFIPSKVASPVNFLN